MSCFLQSQVGTRWTCQWHHPRWLHPFGFSDNPSLEMTLFVTVSVSYMITLVGNTTIILLFHLDPHLHTPMYFFLTNLSILDLCFYTSCIPQMLVHLKGPRQDHQLPGMCSPSSTLLGTGSCWVCAAAGHGLRQICGSMQSPHTTQSSCSLTCV